MGCNINTQKYKLYNKSFYKYNAYNTHVSYTVHYIQWLEPQAAHVIQGVSFKDQKGAACRSAVDKTAVTAYGKPFLS